MSKVEGGTIQVPAGNANSHKNGLRKRKLQKIQPPDLQGQETDPGWPIGLGPP